MNPVAERIIAGEKVCPHEIFEHNAGRIIATERWWFENGRCDPKNCKRGKNCTHGIGSDLWYASELLQRAQDRCTCGRYTHKEGRTS